jgi:hypothetical protein
MADANAVDVAAIARGRTSLAIDHVVITEQAGVRIDRSLVPTRLNVLDRGTKLCGWFAISEHIGVARSTTIAYARLKEDPLPVRMTRTARVWIWSRYAEEWAARRAGGRMSNGETLERAVGWPDISARLGVSTETAMRWRRLSVDRLPVQGVRQPWAYVSALRDWLVRGDVPMQCAPPTRDLSRTI